MSVHCFATLGSVLMGKTQLVISDDFFPARTTPRFSARQPKEGIRAWHKRKAQARRAAKEALASAKQIEAEVQSYNEELTCNPASARHAMWAVHKARALQAEVEHNMSVAAMVAQKAVCGKRDAVQAFGSVLNPTGALRASFWFKRRRIGSRNPVLSRSDAVKFSSQARSKRTPAAKRGKTQKPPRRKRDAVHAFGSVLNPFGELRASFWFKRRRFGLKGMGPLNFEP